MDALSDVISAVRLSGGVFLDAEFTAPWSVVSHLGAEELRALGAKPAQVIAYHYVVAGRLFVQVNSSPAIEVGPGEIVLLPRNDAHVLSSAPGLHPALIDDLVQFPAGLSPAMLHYGGGGEATHIVCGFLGCDVPRNPLLATLPVLLRLEMHADGDWIPRSFSHAAEEFARGGAGSAAVLGKLAELLFVEAIRKYLATLPADQTGWLAGLQDRMVGRALALLHARVAEPWTTEGLAREVGLSRSAFADRFTTLVGVPPMHYLANWRLQLAALRLRDSGESTMRIADDVGYASDTAFIRAFKRTFGCTPATWRRQGAVRPPAVH